METQSKPSITNAEEKRILFEKYILPNQDYIRRLCVKYNHDHSSLDDNYNEALENFYKYIETYNPELSLDTWIHIVTKRFINEANCRNGSKNRNDDIDIEKCSENAVCDDEPSANSISPENFTEHYGDDVLAALNSLKPIYRDALMLQMAGYTLAEITDKLYTENKLKVHNIETVKSRVFLAKEKMRELVTRDGNKRTD